MTHLRIEQNNGVTEEVSSSVITKLYEIAHAGLDVSSYLKGRLHASIGYRTQILYLTAAYPDLYIDVTNYAIPFEDSNMLTYLNNIGVGSNGMVTEAQAAAATVAANSTNTTITKFNELKYFTNITSSKGGWTLYTSGAVQFKDWTALEEVDISNFTSIGHLEGWAYEDTFAGCTSLKTVTASDNLTQIGYNAFIGCGNLEHISGLSGQIEISGLAFDNCKKLENSTFSNVTVYLPVDKDRLFFRCEKITSITLSPNTTKVSTCAFEDSGLTTITGGSVTAIGERAFYNCSNLSTIFSLTSVTLIGNAAFYNSGISGDVNLPALTSLDAYAFDKSNILRILNLGSIINIPDRCFAECDSLISASLPTTVTRLGEYAFYSDSSLQTINGLSNVTHLSGRVFNECSALVSTDIDYSKLTYIGLECFRGCSNLTDTINCPNVTAINGHWTFGGCNKVTSISLPEVTAYGECTFRDTGITSFTISSKVTDMGTGAFYRCVSLTTVTIENNPSFTALGYGSFKECLALTSINIPEGITTMYNETFRYTELTRLDFPSTLTTITGTENFNNTHITTFIFRSTTPPTVPSDGIFVGVPSGFTIYVPDASVSAYQSATGWSQYASSITGLSNL